MTVTIMSTPVQPASKEAKLLSPNYFKQMMLVPPSGFQADSSRSAASVKVSTVSQQESSMQRDASETESVKLVSKNEVSSVFSTGGIQDGSFQQSGAALPTSFQTGTKRSHSRLQVQTVPNQSKILDERTSVLTREDGSSMTSVAKKMKTTTSTTAVTTVPRTDRLQLHNRVVTVESSGDEATVQKALIPAEEVSEYNNIETYTPMPSNAQLVQSESPEVKPKSDDKTSEEVATTVHVNLQYDNYFKYAAGRCAVATTKQGWEFADTDDDTEVGEVLFHRTLANTLAKADKHLKYLDAAERDKGASQHEQEVSLRQPVPPAVAHLTARTTTPTSEFSSEAGHSERSEVDFEATTTASGSFESVEVEATRSLSSGDLSLNDLSLPDDTTPLSSSGSYVEPFRAQTEEIPNTYEIQQQLLTSQAKVKRKTEELDHHLHSHQSRDRVIEGESSSLPKLETATREHSRVEMASSGFQIASDTHTQSDIVLATVLQREEESRASSYACEYEQFGLTTDHEVAQQLQLEYDREMARQIQHEEQRRQQQQQQHYHGDGYRAHDSYHHHQGHSSYNPYHSAARSGSRSRAPFDNNAQSRYPDGRRYYEQGHPHGSYSHSEGGHPVMHPVQERAHHHSYGHRIVGSVEAVHPFYHPGHHGHFAEQDEMEMTYEALSELEDVSRGLDKKTVSRLTTLSEYDPKQALSSADISTSRSCSICLSDFEKGQMVRSLPCFHIFHRHCIDRWLENNKQCPVCQTELLPNNS